MIVLVLVVFGFGSAPAVAADPDEGLLACRTAAAAGDVIHNTLENLPGGQLRPLMVEHYADLSGSMTSDEIEAQSFVHTPCAGRYPIERPRGALWLRFSVSNPNDHQVEWMVAFMETMFDEMALYEQTEAGLVLRAQNGRTLPVAQQSTVSVRTALPVILAPGESRDLYVRVAGTFTRHVTPVLVSAPMFDRWSMSFETVLIVLLGLMALLAALSLILFRNVTAHFYKYYTLYLVSAFLFIFIVYGWMHRLFDVQLPVTIVVPMIQLVTGISIIANIQYCRVLLAGGKRPPGQKLGFLVLTGVAVILCIVAVIRPWQLSVPNNLMLFVSPVILLAFAGRRLRSGLPQVLPLCGSLICLIVGLAISNYFFLSPPHIAVSSSVTEVMLWRAGTFSYALAIIGEAIFMMLAISTMLRGIRSRSQSAFDEIEALRRSLAATQRKSAKTVEIAEARARFVEDALEASAREQVLHFEDRLEEQARKIITKNVGTEGFGAQALASELGVSERTLSRRMKDALDTTPASFIRQTRLDLARDLILLRHYSSVAEVAHATGFSSVSHFAKLYSAKYQETPRTTLKSTKRTEAAS